MATTTLIAETVLAGFQALVWVGLLVVVFGGAQWVPVSLVQSLFGVVIVVLFAMAYAFGIITERLASAAIDRLTGAKVFTLGGTTLGTTKMRMSIMKGNIDVSTYVENYRRQYRMLAATAMNGTLIAILMGLAVFQHGNDPASDSFWRWSAPPIVFSLLLALCGIGAVEGTMRKNYCEHLCDAYNIALALPEGSKISVGAAPVNSASEAGSRAWIRKYVMHPVRKRLPVLPVLAAVVWLGVWISKIGS